MDLEWKNVLLSYFCVGKKIYWMRIENAEQIYTNTDKYTRHFVRERIKSGKLEVLSSIIKMKTQTSCVLFF